MGTPSANLVDLWGGGVAHIYIYIYIYMDPMSMLTMV